MSALLYPWSCRFTHALSSQSNVHVFFFWNILQWACICSMVIYNDLYELVVGIPKVQFSFFCDRRLWLTHHKEKKSWFGDSLNKYVIISFAHKGYKSRTQEKVYEIKWAVPVIALCSWICKKHFWLNMLNILSFFLSFNLMSLPVVTLIGWNQIAKPFKPPPKMLKPY